MREQYLDSITERKYKIALCRFRLSSHKLEIERGRYFNIPREERKCKLCHTNFVENEYHFLLVCPLYRELRKNYFKSYYCKWPTLNKFDQLMSSTSKNELRNLSKYIYFATKLRDENDTLIFRLILLYIFDVEHSTVSHFSSAPLINC